jgi:hypothetical protein
MRNGKAADAALGGPTLRSWWQLVIELGELSSWAPACGIEMSVLTRATLRDFRHPCPFEFHFSLGWFERYERGEVDPAASRTDPIIVRLVDDLSIDEDPEPYVAAFGPCAFSLVEAPSALVERLGLLCHPCHPGSYVVIAPPDRTIERLGVTHSTP